MKTETLFWIVITITIISIVFVLLKGPSIHEDRIKEARQECRENGGQFGVIDHRSTFCLEPRS